MSFQIERLLGDSLADLSLANQPFKVFGRFLPTYQDQEQSYKIEEFDAPSWMSFPDDDYNPKTIADSVYALTAYDEGDCIGVMIFNKDDFGYRYFDHIRTNYH